MKLVTRRGLMTTGMFGGTRVFSLYIKLEASPEERTTIEKNNLDHHLYFHEKKVKDRTEFLEVTVNEALEGKEIVQPTPIELRATEQLIISKVNELAIAVASLADYDPKKEMVYEFPLPD